MINKRWLWVLLASTGCASPMANLRADNRELTDTVAELRADRRAQDRKLRDLEHQLAMAKVQAAAESAPPALPVEVLSPTAQPAAAAPASPDAPRVVGTADDGTQIVYEGAAAEGKPATFDDDPDAMTDVAATRPEHHAVRAPAPPPVTGDVPVAADRLEVTHHIPPVAARAPRAHVRDTAPAAASDGPAAEYRAAVELVKAGSYADAITALRAFVRHYPRHEYADNAQYWIGEAFYAQKDYAHALVEFRATIETYPRGNKVPDALLKVGYCYAALGQTDKAHAVLEQVVTLYPRSEPAALASKRLEHP